MQFQFDVASNSSVALPPPTTAETIPNLLRQMVELQREHLNHLRAASQENVARARNLLGRWQEEHPEFAELCKKAYPLMEKSYVQLLVNLVEDLSQQGDDALDTEFAVQEFLDRYGMKLGQLGHLLSIIGPLSDAAQQLEASKPV